MVLTNDYDVAIIGGGASGLSTALYCKRSGLTPVIIERGLIGGQINNTSTIENYLGVGNISGEDLSESMYQQIIDNDIEIIYTDIKNIIFDDVGKMAILSSKKYDIRAKSIVIATGVKHKELGISGEKKNQGTGVSYCAVCDGYFFKGKSVAVIGGGDSAFEEGAFLADIADDVTIHYYRGEDNVKAKSDLVDKFLEKDNTHIKYNSSAFTINQNGLGLSVGFRERGGSQNAINHDEYDGVFIYVGVEPINDLAKQIGVELDADGYIKVDNKLQTSIDGVFAIGDIIHPDFKQVAVAVSDGAIASKYIKEYLDK